MSRLLPVSAALSASLLFAPSAASEWHFYASASSGNDANNGTSPDAAFRTAGRCVDAAFGVPPADDAVCNLLPGVYREAMELPTSFAATGSRTLRRAPASALAVHVNDDSDNDIDASAVILSGLDPLPSDVTWTRYTGLHGDNATCIFQAKLPPSGVVVNASTAQLFYRGQEMVEAQYPNLDVARSLATQRLTPAMSWKHVDLPAQYGLIYEKGLRDFPEGSLDGARATLNVAHQFYTWTRRIGNFSAANGSFTYPMDLPSINGWRWWGKPNQFFLSGLPVLLDAPGEWVFDPSSDSLLFWPPTPNASAECVAPSSAAVEVKTRDYVLRSGAQDDTNLWAEGGPAAGHVRDVEAVQAALFAQRIAGNAPLNNFHADGLMFRGATLNIATCVNCTFTNLELLYPTFDPECPEMFGAGHSPHSASRSSVSGSGNLLENITLAFSNNHGLGVSGSNSVLTNVLSAFTDYMGSLSYKPISGYGLNVTITNSTAYAFGNAGITTYTADGTDVGWTGTMTVSHCHVHGGGRVGRDHALLYTGGELPGDVHSSGVRWHHNIVHNTTEKCMRADDLSENTTMDHNVVFDCGIYPDTEERSASSGLGITPKGDRHLIFANTIFSTNITDLCVPSCPRLPVAKQNAHSQIFNTVAHNDTGAPCSCDVSYTGAPGGNQSGIYRGLNLSFVNAPAFDFRPAPGSPLIDAGVVFPPYTDGFSGAAPDIGAMEAGQPPWTAGCVGLLGCDDPEKLLALEHV